MFLRLYFSCLVAAKVADIMTKTLSRELEEFVFRIKNLESLMNNLQGESENIYKKNNEMALKINNR